MKVYHGTTDKIEQPLVAIGRPELDFGQGFYLTDKRKQAVEWARRMADRRLSSPIVNVYELDIEKVYSSFRCLKFEKYDMAWLDFIAGNRQGKKLWKGYDFVEVGIANDRVVDTVEGYIAGLISAEEALKRLMYFMPNNQICLLNQQMTDDYLHFVKAINIKEE